MPLDIEGRHKMKNPSGSSPFNKYPKDGDFSGKKVLNLGCGFSRFNAPNVTNLDAFEVCKPEVVWDLNETPLPFADNTFDLIIANHVLEHIERWWGCFEELCRITKVGGIIDVWVPGSGNDSQRGYRDHLHIINQCSWWGVAGTMINKTNGWCAVNGPVYAKNVRLIEHNIVLDRDVVPAWLPTKWKMWMAHHLRNVISEANFKFQKENKNAR